MRLAIADPPYPPQRTDRLDTPGGIPRITTRSRASRWYGDSGRAANDRPADNHPDAAVWDDPRRHRQLLEELVDTFDGWAIATTLDGLEHYLPAPAGARILVWHKTRATPTSNRISSTLEAVIVYTPITRRARPPLGPVPDLLSAAAPRIGFPGAKPPAWTRWVLDALAYDPGTDELVDVFPGSGSVSNAASQGVLL